MFYTVNESLWNVVPLIANLSLYILSSQLRLVWRVSYFTVCKVLSLIILVIHIGTLETVLSTRNKGQKYTAACQSEE